MSDRTRKGMLSSAAYSAYIHRWLMTPIAFAWPPEAWDFLRKNPRARLNRDGKIVPRWQ